MKTFERIHTIVDGEELVFPEGLVEECGEGYKVLSPHGGYYRHPFVYMNGDLDIGKEETVEQVLRCDVTKLPINPYSSFHQDIKKVQK